MRAGVGLWRGKPQSSTRTGEPPAPAIGYAEIPGEIDASQYDPARFETRLEQIPEEGAPLPARDSLMVDAPYAPIERPAPKSLDRAADPYAADPYAADPYAADSHDAEPQLPESVQERTLFDRLAGLRIEPILGRLRLGRADSRRRASRGAYRAWLRGGHRTDAARPRQPVGQQAEPNSRTRAPTKTPSRPMKSWPMTEAPAAAAAGRRPQDHPAQAGHAEPGQARRQGRPARARPRHRRIPPAAARHPVAAVAHRPRPRSTRRRWSRMRACSRPCSTISASRARS